MEKQTLNPTIVYVLAIIGLLCCCIGGLGFILAGIAFFIATKKLKEAELNPENYEPSNVKAMNTAKIVALVILIINLIYFMYYVYMLLTGGYDEIMEKFNEAMEQIQQNQ